eukprot:519201_1
MSTTNWSCYNCELNDNADNFDCETCKKKQRIVGDLKDLQKAGEPIDTFLFQIMDELNINYNNNNNNNKNYKNEKEEKKQNEDNIKNNTTNLIDNIDDFMEDPQNDIPKTVIGKIGWDTLQATDDLWAVLDEIFFSYQPNKLRNEIQNEETGLKTTLQHILDSYTQL